MKQFMIYTTVLMLTTQIAYSQQNFHDFTVKDIDGKDFSFSELKGKKVMIINVASKCMYTKQYVELEELYKKYKDNNFVIIAFPANNFFKQEPKNNQEIKEFCTLNYGVSFPLMEKISVKGKDMHPLYKWLTDKEKNGVLKSRVKWNFQKYLINEDGKLNMMLKPSTKPNDKRIIDWINL